jgi:hypothetical protein
VTVTNHTAALLGALRTCLIAVPGLPASRAWENVTYIPTTDVPYVEDSWLGGPEEAAALGNELFRGTYLYQISLVWPINVGVHEPLKMADKIADAMRGTMLTIAGSGHPGRVVGMRVGPRIQSMANWYTLPITVSILMDF